MYGKLFASMFDGSLYGNWEAIITLQQMVILSDSNGVVDMTPQAISGRTSVPIDIIKKGIEYLLKADESSRSKNNEGRRIVLIDEKRQWGWIIVNHKYYRNISSLEDKREKDKIYSKNKRANPNKINGGIQKSQIVVNSRKQSQKSVHTDTNADTDTDTEKGSRTLVQIEFKKKFSEWWQHYPRKQQKPDALKAFLQLKPDEATFQKMEIGAKLLSQQKNIDLKYTKLPAGWIRNRMWEDEHPKSKIDGLKAFAKKRETNES